MVPLDLADELAFEPASAFGFDCDRRELADERNLAVRALESVFGSLPPVRMVLSKRIPVEAGLGGGSSDAAAVLRAAMSGAFGPAPPRDWLRLARSLGSDVPSFSRERPRWSRARASASRLPEPLRSGTS